MTVLSTRQGPRSNPDKQTLNKWFLQKKEASTCNLAARGNPVMGGVELWGIIVLAAAGSSAQAPHHSALVQSPEASDGAAPPHHPTGGARGLFSELAQQAAPRTPSLKITTKTCWPQTGDICSCGRAVVGKGGRETKMGFSFENRICDKALERGTGLG